MGKHLPPPKNKHLSQTHVKKSSSFGFPDIKLPVKKTYEHQFSTAAVVTVAVAAALLVAALLLPFTGWLRLGAFALPWLVAGAGAIKHAFDRMLDGDVLQEDLIMLVASAAAFCIKRFPEGAIIMVLYRTGELLLAFALQKSRTAAAELMDLSFDNVRVSTGSGVITIKPQEISVGELVIIGPGERIPIDGVVNDGMSSVDVSQLTGEGAPVAVAPGSRVMSGSVNQTNYIRIRAARSFDESTAQRIVALLETACSRKARREQQIARFSGVFTPTVVVLAMLIGLIPPIFNGEWSAYIARAIALLVISCPYALISAVNMAFFGGIAGLSRAGIYVKDANLIETLSKADTMVFDKTGTITEGRFNITDVVPVGVSEQKLLSAAATAEYFSPHPIARALREASGIKRPAKGVVMELEEIPGRGISAFVNGKDVYVGNASLLEEHGIGYSVPDRAGSAIHVAVGNCYWGYIIFSDKLRDGAFDALESLRRLGVRNMVLLTGDVRSVSRPIASSLNFDMVKAELPPDGKVSAVEYLMATKGDNSSLAFVGDSDNDSAALTRADVGIAFGALNSDTALDDADILFMGEDIRRLPLTMELSCLSARVILQNIAVIVSIKLLCLLLGVFGVLPVTAAAFAEAAALIAAMLNALRTFKHTVTEEKK